MNLKSLSKIDRTIERLTIHKAKSLESLLASSNPDDLIKAKEYLKSKKDNKSDFKSFVFSPDHEYYSGNDYKQSTAKINPVLLRRMSDLPNVAAIIYTRIEQILEHRNYTEELGKPGWTIIPVKKDAKITDSDKRDIESIVKFITYGGIKGKWDISDDFDDWIKKYITDSLVLDQTCTEFERNRKGELISFRQAPSETIRILETVDPKELAKYKNHYVEINGFLPSYAQVWNGQIQNHWETWDPLLFYPWEMSFTIRNKSSDIRRNGYGKSELEILSDIITWILWGQQYNGNFFKQGSNPKGFFTIDGYADQNVLNEFRSSWRATMMGVENSHKVPIFEGGKVNWVDMHHSNADMEYQNWQEFLIILLCSVYKIDPSELGYHFRNQADVFGQTGQKERLAHSKSKGLKPLFSMIEKDINKYMVSELDGRFKFMFTGIDVEDEGLKAELDIKLSSAGFVSVEDMFQKYSKRKFDPKKDTLLNNVYLQAMQMKQYGGEESNEAVDEMTGEPDKGAKNPFKEQYAEKSELNDPITSETIRYMEKIFKS